jgi:DNA repair protein RadD
MEEGSQIMERRPNQQRAFDQTLAAIRGGAKRICVTSPTGSGKTMMMTDQLIQAKADGERACLYTNRRMLFDQTARMLGEAGIEFGRRAAGHERALLRDVQLCMTQTELSHVYKNESRELHQADKILIDEAHNQTGGGMETIMRDHIEAGGVNIGYTATPLDIGDYYDELIVVGLPSEMFRLGILVPAETFGPDEPDLKHIRQYQVGEDLSEKDNTKVIMRPGIFGRVLKWYKTINPEQRPTILFAPGVKESIFFAEQFHAAGIPAAHIDGDDVWIDGELHASDSDTRQQVMDASKDGSIKVICNRFVLREGIDAPWLSHGIFATVFGSLTSMLQSGGRLLRSCHGKDRVTIQDHGGNWWRHGSLNEDREWSLELTNHRMVAERQEKIREKQLPEPITCLQCAKVRPCGHVCPFCGFIAHKKSRMVVQIDGELKPLRGDVFRPRYRKLEVDTEKLWKATYYRAYRSGMTFRQAEGLFYHECGYFPPKDLPLMPLEIGDSFRRVDAVPVRALR